MTKQRFGLGWLSMGLLVGLLGVAFGACTRVESDDDEDSGGGGSNSNNSGSSTSNNQQTGNGGSGNVGNSGVGNSVSTPGQTNTKGGASPVTTTNNVATQGGSGTKTTVASGTGNVQGCNGIPAMATDEAAVAAACNGSSIEAEPLPVDMIILMDRSISNSYAVGSETATPAGAGQLTRWQVLTSAMEALATSTNAAKMGASLTFFSYTGGSQAAAECNAADYAKPIVPLGILGEPSKNDPNVMQGQALVDAMKKVQPGGLTPTVPALTGVFQYAMAEKNKDKTREKVVVLISDGYPTLCDQKSPSDISNVIAEAAAAATPIKTFIIGVGSPSEMDGAKFNLQNYARSGNTGMLPFVLDEAQGATGVRDQLVTALLNISNSKLACEFEVKPPSSDWVVDPEKVMFTWKPAAGDLQEIPRVASAAVCSKSGNGNGGWYFDDPIAPKKITLCPCTCTNFGAGRANLYYGCKPNLVIE